MDRQGRRQKIEDRESSPTSAGHPRREDEDKAEELEEEGTIFEGKSRVQIRSKFASERRRRHRRGVQSSIVSLAGNRVEKSDVSESKKVFGRKLTATRDGEGGAHVQLIIDVEEFAI